MVSQSNGCGVTEYWLWCYSSVSAGGGACCVAPGGRRGAQGGTGTTIAP
jgi:hypothetical protein